MHMKNSLGTTILIIALSLALIVPPSIPSVAAQTQAGDDWPRDCSESQTFEDTSSTVTGVLDVPRDRDAFKIELDRGDYITASVLVPEAHERTIIYWYSGALTLRNERTERGVNIREPGRATPYDIVTTIGEEASGENSTWELWANTDTEICVAVAETQDTADFPYEWQVQLQQNSPDLNQSNRRILSEAEIQQRNKQRNQLQDQVADLSKRISELERRVDQLENETNTSNEG